MDMERTRNVWVISQVIFIASTNLWNNFFYAELVSIDWKTKKGILLLPKKPLKVL
jgi:hypothetical protein